MYSRRMSFAKALHLEAAVAVSNLGILSINTAKSRRLAVGEFVHSCLGEVEAIGGVVDSQHVDGLAVVGDAVASSALCGVPALDSLVTTNARERRNVGLNVPSILGDEAVRAV